MGLFTSKEEKERRAEIERKRVEAVELRIKEKLAKMREEKPDAAKREHEQLIELFKDKGLPGAFRDQARKLAKTLECDSNTRAADDALKMAVAHAKHDRHKDKAEFIKRAREFKSRAMALGASAEFQTAFDIQIEQIREMGHVSAHGKPTRAKPKETAPVTPNRAKVEGRDDTHRHRDRAHAAGHAH